MSAMLLFRPFERFWHWTQAVLILGLLISGLEVHGSYHWLGFEAAVTVHVALAWGLIILWVFTIFWHIVTGEWRQYLPHRQGVVAVARYYGYGMFTGEMKPWVITPRAKHNPLQRLAYFGFKAIIAPALWVSGLLYFFYPQWQGTWLGERLPLEAVAYLHTAAAFAILVFLIVHVYLAAFSGSPWYSHLQAMITGYERGE